MSVKEVGRAARLDLERICLILNNSSQWLVSRGVAKLKGAFGLDTGDKQIQLSAKFGNDEDTLISKRANPFQADLEAITLGAWLFVDIPHWDNPVTGGRLLQLIDIDLILLQVANLGVAHLHKGLLLAHFDVEGSEAMTRAIDLIDSEGE